MSIEELQNIRDTYDDAYFGKSDKNFDKTLLELLIAALVELKGKLDNLEVDMANRMLCTKYKVD